MNVRIAWSLLLTAALATGCGQKQSSTTENAPPPDTSGTTAANNPSETKTLQQNTPEAPPAATPAPQARRERGSHESDRHASDRHDHDSDRREPDVHGSSGPQTFSVTVPSGRAGTATLETKLSSETSHEGDPFTATLAEDWTADGAVAFPAGTKVMGHLSAVKPRARGKAKAMLTLSYDKLSLPDGRTVDISAQPQVFEAGGDTQGDATKIVGGTAGGAIIGGATGNAKRGAIIGGLAGITASLLGKGNPMDLGAGAKLNVVLTGDATVTVHKVNS